MSSELDAPVTPGRSDEHKSRMPCVILPIAALFILGLCYVVVVVIRFSPTSAREYQAAQATATARIAIQLDAGATVAAQFEGEATQTALVAGTPSPKEAPGKAVPTPSNEPHPAATSGPQETP